ncbi:MAG: sulfotransferase [Acidimicrobiia bacterium]|nr:sulfotransferase [Acidimicrobiia bacterium]
MSDDDPIPLGEPQRFLFVGGPGRSGTTLMGRTLGMHSQVSYLEETFLLFRYRQVRDVTHHLYRDAWPDVRAGKEALLRPGQVRRQKGAERVTRGDVNRSTDRMSRFWLQVMVERLGIPPDEVILDKSPRDVAHYSWGVSNLPRSRYLVMVRDPRAVIASRLEQEQRRKDTGYVPGARPSADDLDRAAYWAKQWVDYLAIAEAAQRHNAERVLFVQYRDMLLEPARVAEAAQAFVYLDPEPEVTSYLETGGYRDGLLTDQLDSWKDRLHNEVIAAVVETVGARIEPFESG